MALIKTKKRLALWGTSLDDEQSIVLSAFILS